jgi:hypothetical protein
VLNGSLQVRGLSPCRRIRLVYVRGCGRPSSPFSEDGRSDSPVGCDAVSCGAGTRHYQASGLTPNIPGGGASEDHRGCSCDPVITITTNFLLIFVCVGSA